MPAGCLCVSGTAQEQREKLVSTHLYRSLHNCHFLYLKEVAFNAFMVSFFFYGDSTPRAPEAGVQEHRSGQAFSAVVCSFLAAGLHPAL